jgi:hypothetical protein
LFSSEISYLVKIRSGILTYEGKIMVQKGSVVNPNPLEISIVLTDPYPAGIQVSADPDSGIRTRSDLFNVKIFIILYCCIISVKSLSAVLLSTLTVKFVNYELESVLSRSTSVMEFQNKY